MFAEFKRKQSQVEEEQVARKKRKGTGPALVFDGDALKEYVTGMRARKLKRRLEGAKQAAEKDRQEKNRIRKEVSNVQSSVAASSSFPSLLLVLNVHGSLTWLTACCCHVCH